MHANLLTQSDNISGEELRARGVVAWTIAAITREEMEKIGKPGQKTKRGKIGFREPGSKPWIINVTNKKILIALFGEGRCGKQATSPEEHKDGGCYNTDHWIGHMIALGATTQRASGKAVDGVIVAGSSVLTAPLDVEVALPNKTPIKYTIRPPSKQSAGGQSKPSPAHPISPRPEETDMEPGADLGEQAGAQ
jgi:hypothetical protein